MAPADRHAWLEAALERFERPLVGYASHLLGDVHAARDVVQDAFVRLLEADRARVEPILARWLFTVTRRRAIDVLRRRRVAARPDAALDTTPAAASPDVAALRDDAHAALAALATLAPLEQEVLRLRLAFGLSYADIAEVTGITVNHVGVRVHAGLTTLRARLAPAAAAVPATVPATGTRP